MLEKRLNKAVASSRDHRAFAFIYGVPIERINPKTNCVHLNFELDNLDLLEIRSLSLFDHLKRKKAS
uniref:hypothetical protein n=1 Tax=Vibrio sp. 23023 TaxID=452803 RepID=UPI00144A92F2|nr:hypothetical protein [Vibrio sp. 23023]